jgi:glycosyltransferase involved in cell wall biosynthesis
MRLSTVWHLYDYPDHRDLPTRIGERCPPSATLFTSQYVASAYPNLTKRQHVVIPPITVEPNDFRLAPRDDSLLTQLGLHEARFVVTVCRWQPHKGLHILAEAAKRLREIGSGLDDLKFVLVGKPSNHAETAYRSRVLDEIKGSQLEDRFIFVEDCSDAQLRSLYSSAITLVHPALSEGFGLVLLEAMALGLPVVAGDASGPKDILQDGRGGLVVPRGNAEELAVAIHRILSDTKLRQGLAVSATQRASELCRSKMVAQTLKLYEQIS